MRYKRYTLDDLKKSSDRKRFTYISFFAGGGGSSAGYKLAGGDCKFVNEFQQVAVNTYLANWPDTPHICGDIKNVTGKQIMEMTGLKVGELDILDGSPPCPPFSMSGTKKKGWNKEKMAYGMKQQNIEDLTWEMIRITSEMQPKVVICENVKGLTMEYAKQHLDRMVTDFEKEGYTTTFKVLNGIHYGVPQKRQRVFIVSVRNDVMDDIGMLPMILYNGNIFPDGAMNEEPTVEDAIGDLRLDNENSVEATSFFQSRRVPWNQASHTLSEQGLMTSLAVHLHPEEDRGYTTKESARIMTLPEDYINTGTLNEKLARIGLMVAPMMMYHLADSIYENVLKPYNK